MPTSKRVLFAALPGIIAMAFMLMTDGARPAPAAAAGSANDPTLQAYFVSGDYGLYWFKSGKDAVKAGSSSIGLDYYDPARPAVIYVHGYQPGATAKQFRETFLRNPTHDPNVTPVDTSAGWKDGVGVRWNVGVFYWNAFADEDIPQVTDAEAKIWTSQGPQRMRFRRLDVTRNVVYYQEFSRNVSAGNLLYEAYTAALTNNTSGDIRLAGHSLGSQMVVRLAKLVSNGIGTGDLSPTLLPKRVALLDPFWSDGEKGYLGGKSTAQKVNEYVDALKAKGVTFEQYQSSKITDWGLLNLIVADSNELLKQKTAYVRLNPDYLEACQGFLCSDHVAVLNKMHEYATFWYFDSMSRPLPREVIWVCSYIVFCDWQTVDGPAAPSARTSNAGTKAVMGSSFRWEQVTGKGTWGPLDDRFARWNR